jgi:hypothetical protein
MTTMLNRALGPIGVVSVVVLAALVLGVVCG